jgi:hypothetical protein
MLTFYVIFVKLDYKLWNSFLLVFGHPWRWDKGPDMLGNIIIYWLNNLSHEMVVLNSVSILQY